MRIEKRRLRHPNALSLQGIDVCLVDNARKRISPELSPAAESDPRFFIACGNDPRHGPTPLEDDEFLASATDLIEQSQTLSLESGGGDLHRTTVHDQCTDCQDFRPTHYASQRRLKTQKHRDTPPDTPFWPRQRGHGFPVYSSQLQRARADYPFGELCGAGVAFKLAWVIATRASGAKQVTPRLREMLLTSIGFAALGTVQQLKRLAPFGQGNRRPILCASGVRLVEPPRTIGGGQRLVWVSEESLTHGFVSGMSNSISSI